MPMILCPTDFSPNAENALAYAVSLATATGWHLRLFHATPVPLLDPETFFTPATEYSVDESKAKLQAMCDRVAGKISCESVMRVGNPAREIARYASEASVDWIVMGTQGNPGGPDALVGSTAIGVIEGAAQPVLVIPGQARYQPMNKIVLAADLKETPRNAVAPLVALARVFGAEIIIVNVTQRRGQLAEDKAVEALRLEELFADAPSSFYPIVHDDVTEGIEQFVAEQRAEVLALITRKHGFFDSLFHESVTRKVTLSAQVPLLALPE